MRRQTLDVHQEDAAGHKPSRALPAFNRGRPLISLVLLVAAVACLALTVAHYARASASSTPLSVGFRTASAFAVVTQSAGGDFSKFSHATSGHSSRSCSSCHVRGNNSPQPELPGHKACSDCHLQQFVTAGSAMCAICHTNLESGDPPRKNFPALRSFNVRFDHAQHASGAARPASACASCHTPTRRNTAALSIPAGLGAHANCYTCHTPQAQSGGRDIASCGACHNLGGYRRTPTTGKAFAVNFKHGEHGARQGLNCSDCHTLRAGLPQARQVTSPAPTQHFASARGQSCMTCHNNRRAFGGDDFTDCKRCHEGTTFRF
ncbi:MAG TPA: cytochrome c3 family protein [Pyrinomonadaceae bacterium]|nr:cytochrome c3 family protein [Pyrinomonadaceae bacterium]